MRKLLQILISFCLLITAYAYADMQCSVQPRTQNTRDGMYTYSLACETPPTAFYCTIKNTYYSDGIDFFIYGPQTIHGKNHFSYDDSKMYNVGFINMFYFLPNPDHDDMFNLELQVVTRSTGAVLNCYEGSGGRSGY